MGMLFDEHELIPWRAEWQNMPECSNEDRTSKYRIIMHFACKQDVIDFGELIGKPLNPGDFPNMKSVWFPDQARMELKNLRYRHEP